MTFSSAVISPNGRMFWKVRAMPAFTTGGFWRNKSWPLKVNFAFVRLIQPVNTR
ncbi:MAG: hypothetical protein U1E47_07990 [Rivihabitans pingtungensis]